MYFLLLKIYTELFGNLVLTLLGLCHFKVFKNLGSVLGQATAKYTMHFHRQPLEDFFPLSDPLVLQSSMVKGILKFKFFFCIFALSWFVTRLLNCGLFSLY
jgi:hypothetical protein